MRQDRLVLDVLSGFATIAIVSVAVFGEPFRVLTLAGMALVILGCALVLYSQ